MWREDLTAGIQADPLSYVLVYIVNFQKPDARSDPTF